MMTPPKSTTAMVRLAELYASYYRGLIFGVWGIYPQRDEQAERTWETFTATVGLSSDQVKPRVRQAWERVFFEWNLDD